MRAAEATIKAILHFAKPYTYGELETRAKELFKDAAGCVRHPHAAVVKMGLAHVIEQRATPPLQNGMVPIPTAVYENDPAWMRGEYGDAVAVGLAAVSRYNVERRTRDAQMRRQAFDAIPVGFRAQYHSLARMIAVLGAQRHAKVSRLCRFSDMSGVSVIAACDQLVAAGLVDRLPLKDGAKKTDTTYARTPAWTEERATEVMTSRSTPVAPKNAVAPKPGLPWPPQPLLATEISNAILEDTLRLERENQHLEDELRQAQAASRNAELRKQLAEIRRG
jgi:hypothetical protein